MLAGPILPPAVFSFGTGTSTSWRYEGLGFRSEIRGVSMRMKYLIALLAGVFLFLILAGIASAQDQKKTLTKEERLGGTVPHD